MLAFFHVLLAQISPSYRPYDFPNDGFKINPFLWDNGITPW
jgi:hypothetical protein